MTGCFVSGGPDWLFPLVLGGAGAALVALVLAAAGTGRLVVKREVTPAMAERSRWKFWLRRLALPTVLVAWALVTGISLGHLTVMYLPLLAVGVAAYADRWRWRATADSARAPVRRIPVLTVAAGVIAACAAIAAFGATFALGKTVPEGNCPGHAAGSITSDR